MVGEVHLNPEETCKLTRKDELKYVAFHFTDHVVRNGLIRKPASLHRDMLIRLYINYQVNYPSHVKSTEIVEALKEARLLKRRKPGSDSNTIEFKDQIFKNENHITHTEEDVMKPRFKILANQNFHFKNKLPKESEIQGLKCQLCDKEFKDEALLAEHCTTRTHFLRKTYRDHKRTFLTKIENLEISAHDAFDFKILQECRAEIVFKNVGKEPYSITFHKVEVLNEVQFITLIHEAPKTIQSGETFTVTLKTYFTKYDGKRYPMVFEISLNKSTQYLDLLLEPKYIALDDDMLSLAPTGPYEPLNKNFEPALDLPIISGNPLPKPKDLLPSKSTIAKHEIPASFRKILNHGFKKYPSMRDTDEEKLTEVRKLLCDEQLKAVLHNDKALNAKNYVDRWRHLMWIEEHQMLKDITMYNLHDVPLKMDRVRSGLLGLEVPGLLEGRPSVIRGDTVYIRDKNGMVRYEGIVHQVEQSDIYISPNLDYTRRYFGGKVDVEFTFNRYCLKICHRALDQIQKRKVAPVLFPSTYGLKRRHPEVPLKPFFNSLIRNNEQQKQAVQNIVNNSAFPAPYIIYGPPGTGKTATMVEAIMQIWSIFPSSKLCVCAPSNAAADVITERLLTVVPASNILRIYSVSRAEAPSTLQMCSNYDKLGKELYFPSEEEIKRKRIVIITPIMAGKLVTAGFTGGYFDYLFIDEAGHAIEMELIVPIIGLMTSNQDNTIYGGVVLAGDPKQLGPIVRSTLATNLGYDISFMERLMKQIPLYFKNATTSQYNANVIVKLLNNYRSHQVILHVPNQIFYEGQLLAKGPIDKITCACRWEELPTRNFPLIFHGVKGLEDQEKNSPSYFNRLEIQAITEYVKKLIDSKFCGRKVLQEDIGIIAPYRKQVQKIRQHMMNKNWPNVTVASVEEFQGQERLIMIVSTVRSRFNFVTSDYQFGLGFLRSEKRFNVAITRAKALLIVIGNPDVLQCDMRWKMLMKYCEDNNSYRGDKPSGNLPNDFDVNEKLTMDLSALTINADKIPKEEKPGFKRDE